MTPKLYLIGLRSKIARMQGIVVCRFIGVFKCTQ